MPWINKITSPFGDKGNETILDSGFYWGGSIAVPIDPKLYPDLFEFVEEKSDEDLLGFCLFELIGKLTGNESKELAKKLLSNNAIKHEFLEKLRKENR